jgi:protein-disulfide isomerase
MNKRIIVSATFVVIVIIVIVSFASYQANLLEMHDRDRYMENIIASQQSSLINLENGSPPLGSESAPITIVKFGDYQCEACYYWFHNTRSTLIDNYIETGKAKLVFVDLPFLGRDSITAAQASYCAEDQGKYWEYHTMLYTFQEVEAYDSGWADRDRLNAFASSLDMNMDEFNECMDSSKYKNRVKANFDEAVRNGVQSTPTFILISQDGKTEMFAGAQPYSVFAATIESML